ncbi:MAG: DUF4169 family protein [Alphaproteobacteria bacterium]
MADIVNLRQARKRKARAEKERDAAANRARFGRTGAQKACDRMDQERRDRGLDGARLDDDETPRRD